MIHIVRYSLKEHSAVFFHMSVFESCLCTAEVSSSEIGVLSPQRAMFNLCTDTDELKDPKEEQIQHRGSQQLSLVSTINNQYTSMYVLPHANLVQFKFSKG